MPNDVPAWLRNSAKKTGNDCGPTSMHSKLSSQGNSLHSKIAQPTARSAPSVPHFADGGLVGKVKEFFSGARENFAKEAEGKGYTGKGEGLFGETVHYRTDDSGKKFSLNSDGTESEFRGFGGEKKAEAPKPEPVATPKPAASAGDLRSLEKASGDSYTNDKVETPKATSKDDEKAAKKAEIKRKQSVVAAGKSVADAFDGKAPAKVDVNASARAYADYAKELAKPDLPDAHRKALEAGQKYAMSQIAEGQREASRVKQVAADTPTPKVEVVAAKPSAPAAKPNVHAQAVADYSKLLRNPNLTDAQRRQYQAGLDRAIEQSKKA